MSNVFCFGGDDPVGLAVFFVVHVTWFEELLFDIHLIIDDTR